MTEELERLKLVMLTSLQQVDEATDETIRDMARKRYVRMLFRVGELLVNGSVIVHITPEGRTIEFRKDGQQ